MQDNNSINLNLDTNSSYSQFLTPYEQNQETPTSEFEMFRQPLDIYLQIFYLKKKQSKLYKSIFFGLSFIFLFLAYFVYFYTTNWACSIYFQNCSLVKTSIYTTCLILSGVIFGYGYFIRAEKEAALYLFHRMKKTLKTAYKKHNFEMGFVLDLQQETRKRRFSFRQNYNYTLEKMNQYKIQTFHILEQIAYSATHNAQEKNELINQALSEFQNSLQTSVQSFKQKNYLLISQAA